MNNLNITWEKCHHGVEKRDIGGCDKCREERNQLISAASKASIETTTRIPIKRGCTANGPCFCNGSCMEVIGYRDPLFPGERS